MSSKLKAILFLTLSYLILYVNSLTNLQCNQVLCLAQPVQYQCIVTGSVILRWRVRDETSTGLATETYSDGDNLLPTTPLINAPDFSADLSSTDPLISNISFIVQSSINGYSVHCDDGNGDTNCTINIQDPPSPPVNITVSFTETTADITWTPSSISSSQCITSYTVNTTTNNTNINSTDTSISIPLTGLSAGMYCISIASIDTANRIGTHSEQECFELTVPSAPNITYDSFMASDPDNATVIVSLTFNESSILPVTTAYLSLVPNNDPQIFTDSMKPFEFEELTIQRGNNYTVTGFGENIIGNGSNTSTVIFIDINESLLPPPVLSSTVIVPVTSSVSVSVTPVFVITTSIISSPTRSPSSSINVPAAIAITIVLFIISIVIILSVVIYGYVFIKKQKRRKAHEDVELETNKNRLQPDNVIQLQSKSNSQYLCIQQPEIGEIAWLTGDKNIACSFKVLAGTSQPNSIMLEMIELKTAYLAIRKSNMAGDGGDDCDLIATHVCTDECHFAMLKDATQPGLNIQVLPTGQITSGTETVETNDASLFSVIRIFSSQSINYCIRIDKNPLRINSDVIQLKSKLTNKYLRILENGDIDCLGDGRKDNTSRFKVLSGVKHQNSHTFQSLANANKYLAIRPHEYCVIYGECSSDCELVPHYTDTDERTFVSFKSATHDVGYIRVGQDGQITVPIQRPVMTVLMMIHSSDLYMGVLLNIELVSMISR